MTRTATVHHDTRAVTRTGNRRSDLYNADPTCAHDLICAPGGGVKCQKCPGWFCW